MTSFICHACHTHTYTCTYAHTHTHTHAHTNTHAHTHTHTHTHTHKYPLASTFHAQHHVYPLASTIHAQQCMRIHERVLIHMSRTTSERFTSDVSFARKNESCPRMIESCMITNESCYTCHEPLMKDSYVFHIHRPETTNASFPTLWASFVCLIVFTKEWVSRVKARMNHLPHSERVMFDQ